MALVTLHREFLLSSQGKELIAYATEEAISSHHDVAKIALSVKKKMPNISPSFSQFGIETALGRIKLKDRGEWIQKGLFTSLGISQATHPMLAAHHAKRLSDYDTVAEIGSSLGFDTAALARSNKQVITIELDPIVASFCEHNLALQQINNVRIAVGDALSILPTLTFDALWADPARRNDKGERVKNPEEYRPPVSAILNLVGPKALGIKISSAAAGISYPDTTREWIAFEDELTEQVIWRNVSVAQDTISFPEFDAAYDCLKNCDEDLLEDFPKPPFFLIEPHAAFIGSGMWQKFLTSCGAACVGKAEAFGITTIPLTESHAYRQYAIDAVLPLRITDIQRYLDEKGIGKNFELKKRGVSESPDEIRKKLKFSGSEPGVGILTHRGVKKICMMGKRL